MSYTNGLDDPSLYFNTVLYTGDGTTSHAITGVGFQPDWVWIKRRNLGNPSGLFDVIRGATKDLSSSETDSETTNNVFGYLKSFDSDGFTVTVGSTNGARANTSGGTYVGWSWLAGGTASSNTDGSITSQVSANTTSGFSIVSYTGNSTAGATVGHGLGVAPACIIFKNRTSGTDRWNVYHQGVDATAPEDYRLFLDRTDARSNDAFLNDTAPSSSVITLGSLSEANGSTSMIAYCFAEKKGFSKFGSYTGNGSTDGTFVYTGFKPAFVMIKQTNTARAWYIFDNKRDAFNPEKTGLEPNTSDAEFTVDPTLDFVSNGFKLKTSNAGFNASGGTYIYMCFSENPFVTSTAVPTTAR